MKKSRGYWIYDKCQEEALKYKTKSEFRKNSKSSYDISYNNGWLNDICYHMIRPKPHNYKWTYDKCKEEALKYKTRKEMEIKSSSAYTIINKNNWSNDLFLHMKLQCKPNGYWTYKKCKEEALKYQTRSEFQNKSISAYEKSKINKWLNDICSHMELQHKPNGYWTYEKCKEEALKYKYKKDFIENKYVAYTKSLSNDWLDDICSHMIITGNKHKRCIYSYEFSDNSVYVGLTYNIEKRHNERLIDDNDQVTKHTKKTNLQPIRKQLTNYIDVNEAIKLEEFYVNKYKKNGWVVLNIAKTGSIGSNKLKWTYEKCKNEALKYNTKSKFIKNSGSAYNSARKNKWLNKVCSHMIENPNRIWSYERCKEESLKYINRTELCKNKRGAYKSAYKNKWLDEFFPKRNN